MKKISILIPCYNEEENVREISAALIKQFQECLSEYDYEIVFIDNASTDKTRVYLREMCRENKKVKAIFNIRNFGQNNSPFYGLLQTTGDCSITMSCDFQDPVEMIPKFIKEWENGHTLVMAVKSSSKENKVKYFLRTTYYKLFRKMSTIEPIEHFTGFGLYDRSFVNILRDLNDPIPFMRGIIAEFGYNYSIIKFEQPPRKAGKTHNNIMTLYSIAMRSFTNYTRMGIRTMSVLSCVGAGICLIIAIVYFILKLCNWNAYQTGTIPILLIILTLGFFQLFFIGLLGEYMYNLNVRLLNRPLVVEAERLNFESDEE